LIEVESKGITPYGVDIIMMLEFCGIDLTTGNNVGIRLSQSKDRLLGAISQVGESPPPEHASYKL
jgi:hypothetical protein